MDGTTTTASLLFRSPPRILIPKLVHSRDAWKAKAGHRQRQLKAAQIRCRDLGLSRQRWKDRALASEQRGQQLQQQLAQARQELDQAHAQVAALQEDLKKKSGPRR
jgi:chromosome segregation ATPase